MSSAVPPKPIPVPLVLAAGAAMGAADAVPGVSGGTIALIVGVYERLLESLSHVLATPRRLRSAEGRAQLRTALQFLVPLGLGVIVAWWLGTRLLVGPSDAPGLIRRLPTAPLCYAFFFGLVLVSVREPWRRIRTPRAQTWIALVLGAVVAAWFAGLPHNQGVTHDWMLLYGGALAIGVMLLPGISGSLLLLILGQYTAVATAVHDLALGRIGFFALGLAIGAATFVPVLRALLRRFHDVTLAALTGLMLGSLRALWPYKAQYEPKAGLMENIAPFGAIWPVLLAVVLGAASVWALPLLETRIARAQGN